MTSKEIKISGKKFISLRRASENSGYAKDYIGQLCRAGKLESKRLGRDWFVNADDLNRYKHKKSHPKNQDIIKPVKIVERGVPILKDISPSRDLENLKKPFKKLKKLFEKTQDDWDKELLGTDSGFGFNFDFKKFVPVLHFAVIVLLVFGSYFYSDEAKAAYAKWAEPIINDVEYLVSNTVRDSVTNIAGAVETGVNGIEKIVSTASGAISRASEIKMPEISLPEITLPEISFSLPKFSFPKIALPEIHFPEIHFPEIHFPDIKIPEFALPEITLPKIDFPEIRFPEIKLSELPRFSFSEFKLPKVKFPDIEIPEFKFPELAMPDIKFPNIKISIPNIKMPKIELPELAMPDFSLPEIKIPEIKIPEIRIPEIKIPEFALPDIRVPNMGAVFSVFVSNITESIAGSLEGVANDVVSLPENFRELTQDILQSGEIIKIVQTQAPDGNKDAEIQSLKDELAEIKASGLVIEGSVKEKTIVEKTVEKLVSGISSEDLEIRLQQLNNSIMSQIADLKYDLSSRTTTPQYATLTSVYQAVALSQNIDTLKDVTITNPTFSGTISGLGGVISESLASYLPLAGGSLTGDLLTNSPIYASSTLSVDGTTTFNNLTYTWPSSRTANYYLQTDGSGVLSWSPVSTGNTTWEIDTNGNLAPTTTIAVYLPSNLGIGTTSPYAALSVAGEGVFDYITATSTTATSTLPYLTTTGLQISSWLDFPANSITDAMIPDTITASNYVLTADFGTSFYTYFSATTTDYLTEGSTNKYWQDTLSDISLTKGYFIVGDDSGLAQATSSIFVDSTGLVGIGTTSPGALLSVAGTGAFDSWVSADYFIATSTTATSTLPYLTSTGLQISSWLDFPANSITDSYISSASSWNNKWDLASTTIGVAYGGTGATSFTNKQLIAYDGSTLISTSTIYADTGGTGLTSYSIGDLLYASTAKDLSALAITASSSVLMSDGANPVWNSFLGVASGGTGSTSFTAGSVVFSNGTILTQDNSNLFWDDTNNRLGIGTTTPDTMLNLYGTGNAIRLSYDNSNYANISAASNGDLTVSGSSATESAVVIGSGAASQDVSVQFDGNAQDYYIGLDNSDSDKFKIGLGSAIGATPYLTIDSTGLVGIATTSPYAKLSIEGTTASTDNLFNVDFSADGLSTSTALMIGSAGLLGIGTTSPFATLSIDHDTGEIPFAIGSTTATSLIVDASGNVGIGTGNPRTRLELGNDGAILAIGTYGSGWTEPDLGAGTRMLWYPQKAAFRAGYVDSTQWDDTNIGIYSIAMGFNTIANASSAVALGNSTIASGGNATALGSGTTASGNYSTAMGDTAIASGETSIAMGDTAIASGSDSIAMGRRATASGSDSIAVGQNVTAGSAANTIVLGQGVDASNKLINNTASSLMVGFNSTIPTLIVTGGSGAGTLGNVGIGTTSPGALLSVAGTGAFDSWVSADYFIATSTTATTTLAGGLAIATSGFVYDYSSGNVGIGTASPGAKLEVAANGKIRASGSSATNYIQMWYDDAVGNKLEASNDSLFFVGSSGRMANLTRTSLLQDSDANGDHAIGINGGTQLSYNSSSGLGGLVHPGNYDLYFATNNIERMRLSKTGGLSLGTATWNSTDPGAGNLVVQGNLGIGTTSPYAMLSVAGEGVFDYITATSTTATSTIAYGLKVSDGGLTLTNFASCTALETDASGNLVCGSDAEGAGGTGSNWQFTANGDAITPTTTVGIILSASSTINSTLDISGKLTLTDLLDVEYGGTNQNSSAWNGPVSVKAGTWEASTTIDSSYLDSLVILSGEIDSFAELDAIVADGDLAVLSSAMTGTFDGIDFTGGALGTGALWYGGAGTAPSELTITASSSVLVSDGTNPVWNTKLGSASIEDIYLFNNADDITTGQLTAANFVASSVSATTTLAGGLAIETSGFVYDYSSGNVGIGTTGPAAKLIVGAPHANVNTASGHFAVFEDKAGAYTSSGVGVSIGNTGGDYGVVYAYDYANYVAKNLVLNEFGGNVGIGTTTPIGQLSVEIDGTTGYAFVVGDQGTSTPPFYVDYGGITGIENLQTGPMSFDSDAGAVTWIDMPVTTTSASNTPLSYTAKIDASDILTVSALSDGTGAIASWSKTVGINYTTPSETYGLYLSGKLAYCDQAACWVSASSRSLKTHITELTDENIQEVLGQIASTSVYFYNMNYAPDGRVYLGVISEEAPDWITSPDKAGISGEAFANFLMAGMKGVLNQISNLGDQLAEGIVKIKELITEKATTKELCLEGEDGETICITKEQLKQLLEDNQIPQPEADQPSAENEENETSDVEEPSGGSTSDVEEGGEPMSTSDVDEETSDVNPEPELEPELVSEPAPEPIAEPALAPEPAGETQ